MSQEQAKGFFEAISKDKQLAEQVKDVMGGQATNQEKAKELLSLAKAHNFNFTEDELKRSLSREDLVDIAGGGGVLSSLGSMVVGIMQMFGVGGTGGQQPLPAPNPIVNVQPAANNANAQNEGDENEAPAANVDEEVEEIRERTPEEIAERQQREEQRRRELEERLAQGPLEMEAVEPNWFEDEGTNRLFRESDDNYLEILAGRAQRLHSVGDLFDVSIEMFKVKGANALVQRLERLERIYPRVKTYMISSRIHGSKREFFNDEIKEWLRLICTSSKNVDVSLPDLIADADFFIEQATEATRSKLLDTLHGTAHLAERMRNAQIGDEVQQRIIDFCENASAIASGDNVSFEELQELLEEAYSLGDEATAIISSHFAPAPKPETADDENEVEEIRELTPEEIAERQRREEQRRRELEERLARGQLELEESEPNWFEDDGTNRLIREFDDKELINRVNRLNTLYYRLLYVPQSRALMDRIRNYIATVGFTFDRGTESLQEQISIADALIHEAEEMLQSAEQQRGEEIREEIQQGLDALALILQRMHTGLPGETDLYTDVQTFLANRESYSRKERIVRAQELLSRTMAFHDTLDWKDCVHINTAYSMFDSYVWSWQGDEQAILEARLENNALPWLTQVGASFGVPGEHGLALEIQEFLATIDGDFTYEHLAEMNSLLDRAREIMMNRARAHPRFDIDQLHIRNNDLQLAQMLGIDGEYVREKIKNKTVPSLDDPDGFIELPNGDQVAFHFFVGSGTLVLTGSGNTVIDDKYEPNSLFKQLEETGIVFWAKDATGALINKQLPTPDSPFVVRNLIIGNGIAELGNQAFKWAESLRSVYLMGPVRFVGFEAFYHADYLVEVGFAQPEVLERIDDCAFGFAQRLVSINLPQNAGIAENAFEFCLELEKQGCPYCKNPDEL